MKVVDTSVLVAAFATWHEAHAPALRAVGRDSSLIAHVAIETFSVLTRLPRPLRVAPETASTYLTTTFGSRVIALSGHDHLRLLATLASIGISGGAAYDALIAATALEAGARLLTLDQRALATYSAIGADVELVSAS